MRVTNRHTAVVCGIAPGETGEVDADNRGVRGLLAAGFLVPVDASPPAAVDASELAAMRAQFDAAWAEREAAYATELARAKESHATQLGLLSESLRAELAEKDARVTALEAELAQLRAERDERIAETARAWAARDELADLLASSTPAKGQTEGDPPKPARTRKEG